MNAADSTLTVQLITDFEKSIGLTMSDKDVDELMEETH